MNKKLDKLTKAQLIALLEEQSAYDLVLFPADEDKKYVMQGQIIKEDLETYSCWLYAHKSKAGNPYFRLSIADESTEAYEARTKKKA